MNKAYKVIWSKARGCYVVVSELAKSYSGGAKRLRGKAVCAAAAYMALMLMPNAAWAGDLIITDGNDATISATGSTVTYTADYSTYVESSGRYAAIATGTSTSSGGGSITITADKIEAVNSTSESYDRLYGIAAITDGTSVTLNGGTSIVMAGENSSRVVAVRLSPSDGTENGVTLAVNGDLTINASGGTGYLKGIDAWYNSSMSVTGDTTIKLSGDSYNIYGIDNFSNSGKEVKFDGSFTLNAEANGSETYLCGIEANQSTTTFNGDTAITLVSKSSYYTDGVFVQCDASDPYDTIVNFNGDTMISVEGLYAYGVNSSGGSGEINFTGDTANIIVKGDSLAVGLLSQYGANINTSENTYLTVDVSSSEGDAVGIDLENYGGESVGYYNGNVSLGGGADITVDAGSTGIGIFNYAPSDAASEEDGVFMSIGGDLNIDVTATGDAIGILTYGAVEISGDSTNISAVSTEGSACGIYNYGRYAVVEISGDSTNISAVSTEGDAVGVFNTNEVTISGDSLTVTATSESGDSYGILAEYTGTVTVDSNAKITADTVIYAEGTSTVDINTDGVSTTVLNGDIAAGEETSVTVNLTGSDSSWTGNSVATEEGETTSGLNLTIADSASWNVTAVDSDQTLTAVNALTSNAGIINLTDEGVAAEINSLDGESLTVNTSSTDSSVTIGTRADETEINVVGTSNVTDAIAAGNASLQDLADVVTVTDEDSSNQKNVSTAEGTIAGAITAQTDEDGNIITSTISEATNTTNSTIGDMAAIGLMTWRQENNDMNKRLGELRDSKGEHGVWVRMSRGEAKYKGVKNEYNYYQLGYDEKLSTNPRWTVGAALTYTDAENSSGKVSGDNKHTGFAIYGSYLADDGSFLDLIAKYARLEYDFYAAGGVGNADYETNGYSISAEYGKRFTQDNGFWIEPQVELTYGTVGSASYTTANGATVSQDKMDSIVGRLGFAAGKNIKNGNVYVRASYLYDFDGETEARMSKSGVTRKYEYDIGGGWWEVGLGTNLNFSDSAHMYLDVEKTYGGDVSTPWQWNIGMRWSF